MIEIRKHRDHFVSLVLDDCIRLNCLLGMMDLELPLSHLTQIRPAMKIKVEGQL